jgi:hypothetical protein
MIRTGNPQMQRQLDDINVLAYASLQVDAAGDVYFANPGVDLSAADLRRRGGAAG